MLASDGGVPVLTDTTVVVVNVVRNLHSPEFLPKDYTVTILETQFLGVPFQQVATIDADSTVRNFIETGYILPVSASSNCCIVFCYCTCIYSRE